MPSRRDMVSNRATSAHQDAMSSAASGRSRSRQRKLREGDVAYRSGSAGGTGFSRWAVEFPGVIGRPAGGVEPQPPAPTRNSNVGRGPARLTVVRALAYPASFYPPYSL